MRQGITAFPANQSNLIVNNRNTRMKKNVIKAIKCTKMKSVDVIRVSLLLNMHLLTTSFTFELESLFHHVVSSFT